MARYLTAQRLKAAIDRLRQSRASGGMVNFLILKRAVNLSSTDTVNLSTKDMALQQAITELTWWPTENESEDSRPFINVFGSMKAKNHGRTSKKYRSNGPADTLKNGSWSPVVDVSEGDKSKVAGLKQDYLTGLQDLVVLKDGSRPMPLIGDAAAWYFRRKDVDPIIGELDEDSQIEEKLVEQFKSDLDLTDEDVEILFAKEGADDAE